MTNRERAKVWLSAHMRYMPSDLDSLTELLDEQEARVARPFEVAHRCPECGSAMLPPVSLSRCSAHPSEHQYVGPGVALEIREAAKT